MHVLFVHPNFPAQFGHLALHLVEKLGWQATFVSQTPGEHAGGIRKLQYTTNGGATAQNHFCSRTFENAVWNTDGVFQACKAAGGSLKPDLIVGHSGFGSTLFLPELYPGVPVVNLFEYFYRPHHPESDMDFRKDLGWEVPEVNYLRSRCRNAMIMLDLEAASAGYTPTEFQRSCFPETYQPKLRVLFDGVDRAVYHSSGDELRGEGVRRVAGREVPAGTRIVTYVSRGFESMRGFDIFVRAARLILEKHPETVIFVVGTDRHAYGGDEGHVAPQKTFKEWTLARWPVDGRVVFTGRLGREELGRLLAASDLHIYLTVPFVLSWSMMDAMSCGAVVLGSDTAPVREMIRDGENGLLADFFSPEEIAEKAVAVLRDPGKYRGLGRAAEEMIAGGYSLEAVVPEMVGMFEGVVKGAGG